MSKNTKKSDCDLKNRFYVASTSISERNDAWPHRTLEGAVHHAENLLNEDPDVDAHYIVKVIAKVERRKVPMQVTLFE